MFRALTVAGVLAAAGFAATPAPASAEIYLGVGHYGRPHYRPYYGYGYRPYYRPHRPYYRPAYRPRCVIKSTRYWNGYRYVVRSREVCGRRYY
jgi:hypothetical protein